MSEEIIELDDGESNVDILKLRKTWSLVWNDFEKQKEADGKVVAICKHCKKHLTANSKSGTTHLKNHLKGCYMSKKSAKRKLDVGQQLISLGETRADGKTSMECFEFDQQSSRDELTRAIIFHEYPFSIVDHSLFRRFIKSLRPEFKMITRNTAKSDCMKMYEREKENIYQVFEKLSSKVSFTSDMWTSNTIDGYMCLTCHYIDNDWKLQKKIINFVNIPSPHTGEEISKVIMNRLYDWNLDGKVCSFILDNATINDVLIRELLGVLRSKTLSDGEMFHVRCCAHILNLVVQDGLDTIEDVIHNVRESVKYIKSSQGRLERFKKIAKQANCPKSTLSSNMKTRWNSTYLMLDKAMKFREAFSRLAKQDNAYMHAPSFVDWNNVIIVVDCLRTFYEVTNRISATKYPTSNIYFIDICEIYLLLITWYNSTVSFLSQMAKPMLEKFEKYWGICNPVLAIACILDPRYKMKSVEYYYGLIYEDTAESEQNTHQVRSTFEKLYEEYASVRVSAHQRSLYTSSKNVSSNTSTNSSSSKLATNANSSCTFRASTSSRIGLAQFIQASSSAVPKKSELQLYLDDNSGLDSNFDDPTFDILSWWKSNALIYPVIAQMARDLLAIPMSTVASESAFSTAGRVLDDYRCGLKASTVEALICTQDWLKDHAEEFGGALKHGSSTIPLASEVDADFDVLEVLSFEDETQNLPRR